MSEQHNSTFPSYLSLDDESAARERLRDACFLMLTSAARGADRPPICLIAEALVEWFVDAPLTVAWQVQERATSRRLRVAARVADLDQDATLLDAHDAERVLAAWEPMPPGGDGSARARARADVRGWHLQLCRKTPTGGEERLLLTLPSNTPDPRAWMRRMWVAGYAQGVQELATTLFAVRMMAGTTRPLATTSG